MRGGGGEREIKPILQSLTGGSPNFNLTQTKFSDPPPGDKYRSDLKCLLWVAQRAQVTKSLKRGIGVTFLMRLDVSYCGLSMQAWWS